MSQFKPDGLITLRSDVDCRTNGQYYIAVVGDANGDFAFAGAGAKNVHPIGVIQNKPNTGEFGTIATRGTSKVIMAENCSRGDVIVGCDATTGKGEVADAAGEFGVGIALEANAAGDGGVVEVLLTPGVQHTQ
jgi:hypothetical protein